MSWCRAGVLHHHPSALLGQQGGDCNAHHLCISSLVSGPCKQGGNNSALLPIQPLEIYSMPSAQALCWHQPEGEELLQDSEASLKVQRLLCVPAAA